MVAALHQAGALDQLTWGITAACRAVADRSAEHLWVEHDFARPGRIAVGVEGSRSRPTRPSPG
jgi:hypothetical protein